MERTRLEELIQAQLDDALSPAERGELARCLLQDAGARRLHDEYVRTDRLLRDVPAADPPPGLREDILAQSAHPVRPAGSSDPRRWIPLHRLAAAVVAGLLVVGLAYVLSDGDSPGSELQGSLQAGRGPELPGAAARESRASLQADGILVEGVLRREGAALRLELDSSTRMPVEVAVRFDPSTTSFAGSSGGSPLAAGRDEIVVRLPAGRQRTALDFSGDAPVRLELRAGGSVLATAALALSDS